VGKVALGLLLTFLVGCESRPVKELALADVAIRAAQKVKAESLATDEFRRAENYYLRAKKDFAEGYFDSARKYATDARLSAERAEFAALSKQQKAKARDEMVDAPASEGAP
jgi:phage I-like protein